MSSLFDSLMEYSGSPMLDQHFGEVVSITRGSNTPTGVIASWVSQDAMTVTTDGKHTSIVDRFWFVKQSLYKVSGSAVQPRTGDRLTDAAGRVWEILPAKVTPPVVDYAAGDYWKLATKQVT